ncbi:MAG: PIN domain-containing protein [Candidatus Dadabacteria bacterium]|nr:PIN domain-containing protein [Candidatus Dadabacteria bacterium]
MIVKGRFSVDTNILVYAVDRDAGELHERSKDLIGRVARLDCLLTVQALAEFFHVTTRKKLLEPSRASAFVLDWLDVFQVIRADNAALVDAMEAVNEHLLSFWDAMIWAAARQNGCSAILSEDMQDGRRLGGVEFINPFSESAAVRLATLFKA